MLQGKISDVNTSLTNNINSVDDKVDDNTDRISSLIIKVNNKDTELSNRIDKCKNVPLGSIVIGWNTVFINSSLADENIGIWVVCNGDFYSKDEYPEYYKIVQKIHRQSIHNYKVWDNDGFYVPNLEGSYVCGLGNRGRPENPCDNDSTQDNDMSALYPTKVVPDGTDYPIAEPLGFGMYRPSGAPNITGYIDALVQNGIYSGALFYTDRSEVHQSGFDSDEYSYRYVNIDASRVSSIYRNDYTQVIPQTIYLPFYIRIK